MTSIERVARKKRVRQDVQTAILTAAGVAGILVVATIAPGIFSAARKAMGPQRWRSFAHRARTAAGRLVQKGLARYVERNGMRCIELTDTGKRALAWETHSAALAARKKKRWNRRWRMIMFDVPEYRREDRRRIRDFMRTVGFYRLQHSVWVFPYDCEELVALLKADLHIGKAVLYAVVEHIEGDRNVREHFGLPLTD